MLKLSRHEIRKDFHFCKTPFLCLLQQESGPRIYGMLESRRLLVHQAGFSASDVDNFTGSCLVVLELYTSTTFTSGVLRKKNLSHNSRQSKHCMVLSSDASFCFQLRVQRECAIVVGKSIKCVYCVESRKRLEIISSLLVHTLSRIENHFPIMFSDAVIKLYSVYVAMVVYNRKYYIFVIFFEFFIFHRYLLWYFFFYINILKHLIYVPNYKKEKSFVWVHMLAFHQTYNTENQRRFSSLLWNDDWW